MTTPQVDGSRTKVAGTVVGPKDEARLVQVDEVDVEVAITDHMAFLGYIDRPGVVGALGKILGDADINIAGMQVGRATAGGRALTVLTVDSAVPNATMDTIVAEIGAGYGKAVDLA